MRSIFGRRAWYAALLFGGIALAGGAHATDLLGVYRDALAYDAQYAAARAQRQAGREKLAQGRALLLPAIGLSASTSRTNLDAEYEMATPFVPARDRRDFTATGYTLALVQPLYRKQNFVQYTQAEYLVQQSEAAFAAAQQDLALRVSQAYFDVLGAQDALDLIRAQKAAIAEQLAQARQSFEVGAATITDTHEAQARFDLAVAQEIAAQSALELRRRALEQITGQQYAALQPLRAELSLAPLKPDELPGWVELGRTRAYPVIAQAAQVELQTLEVKRNGAGHYPTLDFVASYNNIDQTGTILSPVENNVTTGVVGLQFNLPLYAGGAVVSRTREAASLLEKARADLDGVRRQQALAVEQNFLNVISGINQVRALEQALTSSESALASNKLGYDVGVRINIDVLNAQQQVYSTRRELAAARYGTILNQLRLQAAVGALGEDDIERVNAALAQTKP